MKLIINERDGCCELIQIEYTPTEALIINHAMRRYVEDEGVNEKNRTIMEQMLDVKPIFVDVTDKEQKGLVKDHPDLVRDICNCSSCEHTEDECKDCYPELGYKNDKLKRDTEAVSEFVESDTFKKLMESLDDKDEEDAEQFLRDIKAKE